MFGWLPIIWQVLKTLVKNIPVLNSMWTYVEKQLTPPSTMMATTANGDHIPNYLTIVDPLTIGENTMVQSKLTLPCVFHLIPMVSLHGTPTAVETAIENQKTQRFDD